MRFINSRSSENDNCYGGVIDYYYERKYFINNFFCNINEKEIIMNVLIKDNINELLNTSWKQSQIDCKNYLEEIKVNYILPIKFNKDHLIIELNQDLSFLNYKSVKNFNECNIIFFYPQRRIYVHPLMNIGTKFKFKINTNKLYAHDDLLVVDFNNKYDINILTLKYIIDIIINRINEKEYFD